VTSIILAARRPAAGIAPVDGTFPPAPPVLKAASLPKPIWDPDICIQCGFCSLVCPHAAIRIKAYEPASLESAPEGFLSREWTAKDLPGLRMTIQVAPDDCTGCGVCVDVCPAKSKEVAKHKAINMQPKLEHLDRERAAFEHFLQIGEIDRARVDPVSVKGSQLLEPLFEFSGACAGCGETPYLKLLTQLFGAEFWWPMPPDVRQSTAAICPQPPGPRTPLGGGPPGQTHCSRTTRSSAWECGWRSTSCRNTPETWWQAFASGSPRNLSPASSKPINRPNRESSSNAPASRN
jgi:ferredoxin